MEQTPVDIDQLRDAIDRGDAQQVGTLVAELYPAEIARLIESLPAHERQAIWTAVPDDSEGEVLVELNEEVRSSLVEAMASHEVVAATEGLDIDDLADFVADLPENLTHKVLESLSVQDRERLQAALAWPADSAGGLMNPETVSVRPDVNVDVVLRYLRMRGELPVNTDSVFVVDREDHYLGVLTFARLLTSDPEAAVTELMDPSVEAIQATSSATEVAREFQDRDLVSAAVIDGAGRLIGQITVDDVVDVIQEQADHDILSRDGLDEDDDMFAPILTSSGRRAVWLAVHLTLAFSTAAVINLFQATMNKVILLAVLMPMVAALGGIAGSQTLTLMIRSIALGRIQGANISPLLRRELSIGLVNSLLSATVVAGVTAVFFRDWRVAGVIAAATAINLLIAAAVGFGVPLALRRLRIDPALAGSVILITVTDLVGFVAVLGLGTLLLT
ncbi:MAG: magnesium transporter [Pseudomonadota bacterium]|jgi:magnesium transporter|nr:magnesium transporter [Pseudomonadota bacterium]